ncbi:MAG TPA: FKBP-type peptidyl-prolyl cis-trans isomerase [Pseudomonadales bacterium]
MSDNSITTDEQRVSYGFGLQFGQQLLRNQFDGLDPALVARGINDLLDKKPLAVDEASLNQAFAAVQQKMQAEQARKAQQMQELGRSFLAQNAARDGVVTTASGLQYEVLEAGSGRQPSATSQVKTHYHGCFLDGSVFDSSIERGEPATFALNQVISGWTEALQLMAEGAKWRIFLPPELAYGDMGSPPVIPPGSALQFDIHLLEVLD